MGERYSEAEIHRQIHEVPVQMRRKMVEDILATINPDCIRRGGIRFFEVSSTLKTVGLTFIWTAWEFSREIPNNFLDDEKDDPATGYKKLINGVNHWWPHAPGEPEHGSKRLHKKYKAFEERCSEDPLIRGAISTAIVVACMRKEGAIS